MTTDAATATAAPDDATTTRVLAGARWLIGAWGTCWLYLTCGLLLAALVPLALGWSSAVVLTGSMRPHVRPGDVVVSAPADPATLRPGQVITYTRDGRPSVTHRITTIAPDGLITTKGDANRSEDPFAVHPDQVAGRGRLLVPYIGLPALWLRRGQPLLAALAALSVTLSYFGHRLGDHDPGARP